MVEMWGSVSSLEKQIIQDQRKWLEVMPGKVYIKYWEHFLHWDCCQALILAAQRSGGITIPGSVQKTLWIWHLGTWFSGENGSVSLMVELEDLRGPFPTLRILWFCILFLFTARAHYLLWEKFFLSQFSFGWCLCTETVLYIFINKS